jgi:eukaryotic-like serine/threonine-protein kinase
VGRSAYGRWSDNPVATARFEREARAAALSHPNRVGAPQGSAYLVLRSVEGGPLRRHLATRGRLNGDEGTCSVRQILAAGLIHRDVKPKNARLRVDVLLRITVFGIAVATVDKESRSRLMTKS